MDFRLLVGLDVSQSKDLDCSNVEHPRQRPQRDPHRQLRAAALGGFWVIRGRMAGANLEVELRLFSGEETRKVVEVRGLTGKMANLVP